MKLAYLISGLACLLAARCVAAADESNVIRGCYLVAIEQVRLPASENGMLIPIRAEDGRDVEEGDSVEEGQIIAQIDDRQAIVARRVAEHQYKAAKKQAENEISVQAADASHKVAYAELKKAEDANARVSNSYSSTEVDRLRLNWERAGLQIELAKFENVVAALDARAKFSQYEQADAMIDRLKLRAPHPGVVVQIFRRRGDWVNAGDPVMQLVRMDQLRVKGSVSAKLFNRSKIRGRDVQVVIKLAGGSETHTVNAKIDYASYVVEDDKSFSIWVNIPNQKIGDDWLLGPGLEAEIHLR